MRRWRGQYQRGVDADRWRVGDDLTFQTFLSRRRTPIP
jgi:hypothetical protein